MAEYSANIIREFFEELLQHGSKFGAVWSLIVAIFQDGHRCCGRSADQVCCIADGWDLCNRCHLLRCRGGDGAGSRGASCRTKCGLRGWLGGRGNNGINRLYRRPGGLSGRSCRAGQACRKRQSGHHQYDEYFWNGSFHSVLSGWDNNKWRDTIARNCCWIASLL